MIDGQRTVGLMGIASATIEQAVEDYQMLVEKGILTNGDFIRWEKDGRGHKKGDIKNPPNVRTHKEFQTVNQVQQLLTWMTGGGMQEILEDARLKLHSHYILKSIGFAPETYWTPKEKD